MYPCWHPFHTMYMCNNIVHKDYLYSSPLTLTVQCGNKNGGGCCKHFEHKIINAAFA